MILTGYARLGKDAEVRYMQDNTPVANLALAFNYGRKDEQGNRPTQWVDAALWGQRADALAQYLVKGQGLDVTIEDVHIETYQATDGRTGSKLVGRVAIIGFAGSAPQQDQGGQGGYGQQRQPQGNGQQRQPQGQPQGQRPANNSQQGYGSQRGGQQARQPQGQQRRPGNGFENMDDDIPF
jgi:single-strand DNA-binding protein